MQLLGAEKTKLVPVGQLLAADAESQTVDDDILAGCLQLLQTVVKQA